jgi:protocatechuate 3,4-dioxygenase beta subunit
MALYSLQLPQLLDIGVIDVNTCKPLPSVLVDIWQANATGYYAGALFNLLVILFHLPNM